MQCHMLQSLENDGGKGVITIAIDGNESAVRMVRGIARLALDGHIANVSTHIHTQTEQFTLTDGNTRLGMMEIHDIKARTP